MLNSRTYLVLALFVLTAVLITGCTQAPAQASATPTSSLQQSTATPSPSSQQVTPSSSSPVSISIKSYAFNPSIVTIKAGTTVTWVNEDSVAHTATSSGAFDSGTLSSGQSFSRVFNDVGSFDYTCTFHPNMKGTIVVER